MSDKSSVITTPSCSDETETGLLSVSSALAKIQASLQPLNIAEKVSVRDSLGRILAEPIISPLNVPAHTNSAMDGYAIAASGLATDDAQTCNVIGTALAGKAFSGTVQVGECVRVMTGAVMPSGTDTVIIQEHAMVEGDTIRFNPSNQQAGQNVRQAGEDLAVGQSVLSEGKLLLPAELGLLASLGIAEVSVMRRLRVAFFSTGDELRSIGQSLQSGQIYDSNRYTLYGMLTRLGVELIDMGVVPDNREALHTAFSMAAQSADAIITSGGVSVGEADFIKPTLNALGEIHFWKIAMKPGRPLAFGKIHNSAFFGLPGNPVAVMVTFYQFVQPALQYLMGCTQVPTVPTITARCVSKMRKKPGRAEFPRGILWCEQGEWLVRRGSQQGSGILRSMSEGNCFLLLSENQGDVMEGDLVTVQPFAGLI